MRVLKYALPVQDRFTLQLPARTKIIHVGHQADQQGPDAITIWAEVEPNNEIEQRQFAIVGTGHPVPDRGHHHGSTICPPFVWHLYEIISR